jgi:selenide,water dikinase
MLSCHVAAAAAAAAAAGFAITGHVRPEDLLTKAGLAMGHVLILTKPLGTGTILAAAMKVRPGCQTSSSSTCSAHEPGFVFLMCIQTSCVPACEIDC